MGWRLEVSGIALVVVGLVGFVNSHVQDVTALESILPQPVVVSMAPLGLQSPAVPAAVIEDSLSPADVRARMVPITQPAANAVPVWLSVPSVGIDESILPQGLNAVGELEPPPGRTIWYYRSARPGQAGISVIAGHVQWGTKPDTFWFLSDVADGALFTIRYSDGTVITFVVVGRKSEPKDDVMGDPAVWGSSETPVQVLVTCDNKHSDLVGHHYLNNLVVFGKPVPS